MEENKVAPDDELWKRAERLVDAGRSGPEYNYDAHVDAIFRELVKVRDSSAPNSPELTRLSGEQAEEHTAREGREWRCFHCDEVFTDEESATEHFGKDEYETSPVPGCVSPLRTDEKARLKEVADANDHAMKMQRSAEENDDAEGLLQQYREETGRLFGMVGGVKASTPHQAWLVLDSKQGEVLAAKEECSRLASRVEELEKGLREIAELNIHTLCTARTSQFRTRELARLNKETAVRALAGAHAEEKPRDV